MLRRFTPLPLMATALAIVTALLLSGSNVARATDLFPTKRPLHETQPETYAQLGYTIAIGDINGDSYHDIVAAAPYADVGGISDAGEVVVFLGPCFLKSVTLQVPGLDAGANLGRSLAVGNVGGDTKDDIVVGAPYANVGSTTDAGKVFIFYGAADLVDRTSADVALQDPNPEAYASFGYSLAIGNVGTTLNSSTDDKNDLLVGSPFKDYYWGAPPTQVVDVGRVFVFFGPTIGSSGLSEVYPSDAPNRASARFGYSLATGSFDPANPDGTTYADILSGAPTESVGGVGTAGAVHLFQGRKSFPNPLISENARMVADTPTSSGFFGTSVTLGDVNGDGKQDLLTGASLFSNNLGRAYLTLGRTSPSGQISADLALVCPEAGIVFFGTGLAIGDLNSDGYGDMAVSGPWHKKVFLWYGSANVDSGIDLTLDDPIPQTGHTLFGNSLAIEDVDFNWPSPQDGTLDLIAGAPVHAVASGGTNYTAAGIVYALESDPDADSDGLNDGCDNCVDVSNPDQANSDSIPLTFTGWSSQGVEKVYIDYTIPTSGNPDIWDGWMYWNDWQGDVCDADDDNDGRSDSQETDPNACGGFTSSPTSMNSNQGTDPTKPFNLDVDGFECLSEVPKGITDPSSMSFPGTMPDSDGDGLPNIIELQKYGLNPESSDTDGDGLTDDVEVFDVTGDTVIDAKDAWSVCAAVLGEVPYSINLDLDKNGVIDDTDMEWMNDHSSSPITCAAP